MKKLNHLVGAFLLSFVMVGFAQAQAPATSEVHFQDQQLEQFVAVQPELAEIRQDYSQRLESLEDPAQAQALEQEAIQLMVEAVEEQGLDIELYNSIAMAVQSNPELRERIESMMN
ncbi:DUF4168 domain-containing protein [Marinospirillum sp. MEB164]|uniref:DUF4168 domain-containing protein n=1 Tax=Marinospirillum alkalitolerans TaxID=3123374 RepID=A0ABW8PUW0_9GAMM